MPMGNMEQQLAFWLACLASHRLAKGAQLVHTVGVSVGLVAFPIRKEGFIQLALATMIGALQRN